MKKFLIDPTNPPMPPLPLNTYQIIPIRLPKTARTPTKYPMGCARLDNVLPIALIAHPNTFTRAVNRFCSPLTMLCIAELIEDIFRRIYDCRCLR